MEGSLRQYLNYLNKNKRILSKKEIKRIFYQIVKAVDYLHQNQILHRDLKSSNVLINWSSGLVKIADFGFAKHFNLPFESFSTKISKIILSKTNINNSLGTIPYLAPEVLLGFNNYGIEVDIWSLGCIFAELYYGNVLFNSKEPLQCFYKIITCLGTRQLLEWRNNYDVSDLIPEFSEFEGMGTDFITSVNSNFGIDEQNFLEWMLSTNPMERPTCKEILNHSFFN
jgi:serine/threonine protein kinase